MKLTVKPISNSDGVFIFLLEKENYPDHYYKYRNLILMINDQNYYCLKLLSEDKVLGYALLLKSGPDLELIRLTIKKSEQHQGYGQWFLQYLLTTLQFEKLFLEVNTTNIIAQKLYQANGFAIIRTIDKYYGQNNAIVMEYKK
ncbi:ribosomal-protein-alanine acetyltransferase [Spiroplasma syrphidicola EA-1]|uniref:Ribosomal-protein-alanine acetyltransferase n=1 Tax=Spiroplasma syrphidicola EA-1 TaxID=1276229 RepID=R4UEF5_9MOLU|nr:GNAT family N-acetyltransferase [Spiroplasma syrphidicola]AGM26314.1 ribosomal-protein-alanine acetyltransferase [Spiroplasma syrphidicola EA-1]